MIAVFSLHGAEICNASRS